jgi:1-acyl-sn-glycerol-3-phosphate acyltransferase
MKDLGPVRRERPVWFEFGEPFTVEGSGKEEQKRVVDFIASHLTEWGCEVRRNNGEES